MDRNNKLFLAIAIAVILIGIAYWGVFIQESPVGVSPTPTNGFLDRMNTKVQVNGTPSPLDRYYCEKGYRDQYDAIMENTNGMPPDAKAEYLASFPDQEMLNVTALINQYCQ